MERVRAGPTLRLPMLRATGSADNDNAGLQVEPARQPNSEDLLLVHAHRQAVTTLAAPIVQHFSAIGGFHAGSKAMGPQPALTVGLISALHESPPQRQKSGAARKHAPPELSRTRPARTAPQFATRSGCAHAVQPSTQHRES
jgi:hypothetical protein